MSAVNVALGVVLMPFTIRHLGASEYGLWMLVASLTYYFQLLDLGYGSGLVRHVAAAPAAGAIPAIAVCVFLWLAYPPTTIPAILFESGAVGIVYLAAVCVLGFDRVSRARYLDYVRNLIAAPRAAGHPVAEVAS